MNHFSAETHKKPADTPALQNWKSAEKEPPVPTLSKHGHRVEEKGQAVVFGSTLNADTWDFNCDSNRALQLCPELDSLCFCRTRCANLPKQTEKDLPKDSWDGTAKC